MPESSGCVTHFRIKRYNEMQRLNSIVQRTVQYSVLQDFYSASRMSREKLKRIHWKPNGNDGTDP